MDKKLIGLLSIFFISFFVFVSIIVFNQPLSNISRAKEDTQPSSANSLIFAWPLVLKANGADEAKINVFVRSQTNKVIPNKLVNLNTTLGQVKIVSNVSDNSGQATFTLVSDKPGIAEVSTTIDSSITLDKKLSIKFE